MADATENPAGVAGAPAAGAPNPNILDVHSRVVQKHGVAPKRRQGERGPDKTPRKPRSGVAGAAPGSGVPPVGDPVPDPFVDVELIRKSVESLCRTVDKVVVSRIYREARALTRDEEFARGLTQDAGMREEELELISSLTARVCEQYQLAGQHAPAVFLAIAVAGYGTRVTMTLQKLNELQAIKEKADKHEQRDQNAPGRP